MTPGADIAALARLPRCACGGAALAFRPGAEGEAAEILGTLVPLRQGEKVAAWCAACWPAWGERDAQAV